VKDVQTIEASAMTDAANFGTLIHHLSTEDPSHGATSQVDLQTWRILKKALKTGLSDRGIVVGDDEASFMTRFMLGRSRQVAFVLSP
jgi:hypothetical protein